jgi:outer membrane biosynthesis protein TonB
MSTDALAQSESRRAGTSKTHRVLGAHRVRPAAGGALLGALVAAAAIALPAPALAATTTEATSGYSATLTLSTATVVTTTVAPAPTHEEKPKEEEKPKHETKPKEEESTPKTATTPSPHEEVKPAATSKSLPFTGLNLVWIIGGGLLLLGLGVVIRLAQRRHN